MRNDITIVLALFCILSCCCIFSCDNNDGNGARVPATPNTNSISGQISNVQISREDDNFQDVVLTFSDNRVIRLRAYYTDPIQVTIGQQSTVNYDPNTLRISEITAAR